MTEENRGNFWLVDGRYITHQAPTSYPRTVDVGFVVDSVAVGTIILEIHYYYFLLSILCRVFTIIHVKETVFLGYAVLQLFCI